MTAQQEEIATIKERILKLKLSDADCERISKQAGEYGLTVGQLIENFIGDLVNGTYSNGSDERDCATRWFERCWFGMFPEKTLLHHLLEWGYEPEEYLELLENIETAKKEMEYYKEHPEECDEEGISYIEDDIKDWENELNCMTEDWKPEKVLNMSEEIEIIRNWLKEYRELLGF